MNAPAGPAAGTSSAADLIGISDAELDALGADPTLSAAVRLAVSRERLRRAMVSPRRRRLAAPGAQAGVAGAGENAAPAGAVAALLGRVPGFELLREVAESWWSRHPLRTAAAIAGPASRAYLAPVARRSPIKLVAIGLAAGGLLMLSRPWRWLIRPVLFAGLLPQLVSRVVARLPIESWVEMASRPPAAGALPPPRDPPR